MFEVGEARLKFKQSRARSVGDGLRFSKVGLRKSVRTSQKMDAKAVAFGAWGVIGQKPSPNMV